MSLWPWMMNVGILILEMYELTDAWRSSASVASSG